MTLEFFEIGSNSLATYDTDEEQIEAIKRWWSENGNSLLMGIAVVVVGVFGWRQWQSSQQAGAEQASNLYQQIMEVGSGNAAAELPEEQFSTAAFLNEQLRSEHDDSIYARYGALFMAKLHVDAGDLDSAEAQLSWILDNPDLGMFQSVDQSLLLTARLRLARVLLAQGEAQRALDLLGAVEPGPFAAAYAEAEGDAWIALGEQDNARAAYQRAQESGSASPLVELKLRDLGAS